MRSLFVRALLLVMMFLVAAPSLYGEDEGVINYKTGAAYPFRQVCVAKYASKGERKFYAVGRRSQRRPSVDASIINEIDIDWASPRLAACDRLSWSSDTSGKPVSPVNSSDGFCFSVPVILPETISKQGAVWNGEFRLLIGERLKQIKVKYSLSEQTASGDAGLLRISFDWSSERDALVAGEGPFAGSGVALFDQAQGRVAGEIWETTFQEGAERVPVSCAWMEESG